MVSKGDPKWSVMSAVSGNGKAEQNNGLRAAPEQELADFMENAPVALHWIGADGAILWANAAELRLLGYARGEYVGRNIREFHVDQEAIADILHRLGNGEDVEEYECQIRCKDGSVKDIAITSNVLWEGDRFVHTRS